MPRHGAIRALLKVRHIAACQGLAQRQRLGLLETMDMLG